MIQPISFAEEHIRELQKTSKRDPVLLERAVYAFGLLEALARVGMPFIFKGGTCLMLLMNRPRRLSTDIDIIVEPGTDLDAFIEEASKIFPFQSAEEQKRIGKNNIEKRHFKFTYDSPVNHKPLYILLDVLFEENHYAELISKEIRNELLQTQPEYLAVQIPSADCILADKLTAFAPHTTGILLLISLRTLRKCTIHTRKLPRQNLHTAAAMPVWKTAFGIHSMQRFALRPEEKPRLRNILCM